MCLGVMLVAAAAACMAVHGGTVERRDLGRDLERVWQHKGPGAAASGATGCSWGWCWSGIKGQGLSSQKSLLANANGSSRGLQKLDGGRVER